MGPRCSAPRSTFCSAPGSDCGSHSPPAPQVGHVSMRLAAGPSALRPTRTRGVRVAGRCACCRICMLVGCMLVGHICVAPGACIRFSPCPAYASQIQPPASDVLEARLGAERARHLDRQAPRVHVQRQAAGPSLTPEAADLTSGTLVIQLAPRWSGGCLMRRDLGRQHFKTVARSVTEALEARAWETSVPPTATEVEAAVLRALGSESFQ